MHSAAALDEIAHGSRLDRLRELRELQEVHYAPQDPPNFRFEVDEIHGPAPIMEATMKALLVIGPFVHPLYRHSIDTGRRVGVMIVPQKPMLV